MNEYLLNADEIDLVLSALRYTVEYGYSYEIEKGESIDEYQAARALIDRLTPKPVKKEGWMVKWDSGEMSCIFDSEQEARDRYGYPKVCKGKIIKVTWEE